MAVCPFLRIRMRALNEVDRVGCSEDPQGRQDPVGTGLSGVITIDEKVVADSAPARGGQEVHGVHGVSV